jgi:adenylyltransferase/sulfurtransferase
MSKSASDSNLCEQSGDSGEEEQTIALCSDGSFMVRPLVDASLNIAAMAKRFESLGQVTHNNYLLHVRLFPQLSGLTSGFTLFADGRAVFRDSADATAARSAYAQFIGT